MLDARNMFPEMLTAVRTMRPKAILIENVKGLLRQSFANYFQYIKLMLAFPEVLRKDGEQWGHHLARLEEHETSGSKDGLCYNVVHELLNASNYGVPQKRERVFIVCFRNDLGIKWHFPKQTHSEALLWESQFITGEYWNDHKVAKKNRRRRPARKSQPVSASEISSTRKKSAGRLFATPSHRCRLPDRRQSRTTSNSRALAAIRATLGARSMNPPRPSKPGIMEYPEARTPSSTLMAASAT